MCAHWVRRPAATGRDPALIPLIFILGLHAERLFPFSASRHRQTPLLSPPSQGCFQEICWFVLLLYFSLFPSKQSATLQGFSGFQLSSASVLFDSSYNIHVLCLNLIFGIFPFVMWIVFSSTFLYLLADFCDSLLDFYLSVIFFPDYFVGLDFV